MRYNISLINFSLYTNNHFVGIDFIIILFALDHYKLHFASLVNNNWGGYIAKYGVPNSRSVQ